MPAISEIVHFILLRALLTAFVSIKLSYYADALNRSSKVSGALIGGVGRSMIASAGRFFSGDAKGIMENIKADVHTVSAVIAKRLRHKACVYAVILRN